MKTVSGKDFVRSLERHGWTLLRIRGSHHIFGKPGNPFRLSVPVHGSRPLKEGLQRRMMQQSGLSDDDL